MIDQWHFSSNHGDETTVSIGCIQLSTGLGDVINRCFMVFQLSTRYTCEILSPGMLQIEAALPSGKRKALSLPWSSTVADLLQLAQRAFQLDGLRLAAPDGHLLRPRDSLETSGIQQGDCVAAVVVKPQLAANGHSFALFWEGGRLVTWGHPDYGGDSTSVQSQLQNVQSVQSTERAFAAILKDGTVVTWGDQTAGGDSSAVRDELKNVRQIQATECAFAAILDDGKVVTWGHPSCGGDSRAVQERLRNVRKIQSTDAAFAAMLADGQVVSWGSLRLSRGLDDQLQNFNVQQLQAAELGSFAAIGTTGRAVDWGHHTLYAWNPVFDQLENVRKIQATSDAFAAILADGTVSTSGFSRFGGDSTAVQHELRNVQQLQATHSAFAAIRADGTVVTWGSPFHGGDCQSVQQQLRHVKKVQVSRAAFAAIRVDGNLVTWGDPDSGGDSSCVQCQLRNVQQVQSTSDAFAAILENGTVITWGSPRRGGCSMQVQDQLTHVEQIQSTLGAFAAIRDCTSTTSPRSSRAWCAPATMAKCRQGNQAKVFGPCMQLLVMLIWFCLVSPTSANEVANQFAFCCGFPHMNASLCSNTVTHGAILSDSVTEVGEIGRGISHADLSSMCTGFESFQWLLL